MKSLWNDADARLTVERYEAQGVGEDVALRVYTTRLLGAEPRLVLHGGGNTSVKTRVSDVTGEAVDVICVKGSGWDMAAIEPAGLPAVRLEPLRRLAMLDRLADADMVNLVRRGLLDSAAPNPSVETLLHAFLPHRFVDHTHSNAVLALTDQPDGEAICRDVFGTRVAIVPYVMPGFELARKAAEIAAAHPDAEGLILLKHGIFTFDDTARGAYERMIELVTLAEERLRRGRREVFPAARLPGRLPRPSEVAPLLRGLLAVETDADEGSYRRFVLSFRTGPEILEYVNGAELDRYSQAGTVTPDHAIRTKPAPLIVPPPHDLADFAAAAARAVEDYTAHYLAYFERNNARVGGDRRPLDPSPRVVLVPGLGLFAAGDSARAAAVAGDIAEAAIEVITDAERIGRFESLSEGDLFDMEYWSLEQAKLGKAREKPLARHIAVVTGAAGAIGRATAAEFRAAGAEVALLDRDADALTDAAREVDGVAVVCDVTDDDAVAAAFERVVEAHGGVDILVSNAGAAWQGRIGEVSDEALRASFELNFFAHQRVARAAVAVMLAQKTGGVLLFNASKQALNPGPDFGPYGLPKTATLALARQYAIDYAADGIRSNAVNADRIRSGLMTEDMIVARARARGVSEAEYVRGNLLRREVRAGDVARAFVDLAMMRKTTGALLPVDGGNIAAMPR